MVVYWKIYIPWSISLLALDVAVYQEKQKVTGTVRDGCTLILIYLTKAAIYQMLVMLSSMLVLAGTGIVGSTLKKCTISRFQYQLLKWFIELSNTRGEVE